MSAVSFEEASMFAQTWGLLLLAGLACAVLVYTFWPGNRAKFEQAARAPLQLDEDDHDGGQERN